MLFRTSGRLDAVCPVDDRGRPDRHPAPTSRGECMTHIDESSGRAVRIGLVGESTKAETRVALVPDTVRKVVALGYAVTVQSGAGIDAGFDDVVYAAAGAVVSPHPRLGHRRRSDDQCA